MRKKINYEKVTFLGGFRGEPLKKKEIRSLQLYRKTYPSYKVGLELYSKIQTNVDSSDHFKVI